MFVLVVMYMLMLFMGWGIRYEDDIEVIGSGWASVWVKFFSVWATGAIYLWCFIVLVFFFDCEF